MSMWQRLLALIAGAAAALAAILVIPTASTHLWLMLFGIVGAASLVRFVRPLGYWVDGAQRMQYKVRYRPLERLGPDGWRRFSDEQQAGLIAAAAVARREDAPAVDGGGKDGTPGGQFQYKIG